MYVADIYTVLANLTGIPAISLPLAEDKNGLPMAYNYSPISFRRVDCLLFQKK